jgi:hypothetical protein
VISLISAGLFAPYLFYEEYFFFGALLLFFGFQNFQLLQKFFSSSRESAFSRYMRGLQAINENNLGEAKLILKKLIKTKDLQIKHSAIESLAKVYFCENKPQKSYDLLLKADHQFLKEGKCLLCKLAFDNKNFELISKYSRDIYAIEPSFEIALLNSKAFASLNQPFLAGAWLQTASQFGEAYRLKAKDLIAHQIYDSVREQDAFKKYAEEF